MVNEPESASYWTIVTIGGVALVLAGAFASEMQWDAPWVWKPFAVLVGLSAVWKGGLMIGRSKH